jgi:hypothetical protein
MKAAARRAEVAASNGGLDSRGKYMIIQQLRKLY